MNKDLMKIVRLSKDIIVGNDSVLSELRGLVNDFFKNKLQENYNEISKWDMMLMVLLKEVVETPLTEVDRARIDKYIFGGYVLMRYLSRELYNVPLKNLNLKLFVNYLFENINVEGKDSILAWVDFVYENPDVPEDCFFESVEQDFRVEISTTFEQDVDILVLGKESHRDIMNESLRRIWI